MDHINFVVCRCRDCWQRPIGDGALCFECEAANCDRDGGGFCLIGAVVENIMELESRRRKITEQGWPERSL